jgi:hypothetical protein
MCWCARALLSRASRVWLPKVVVCMAHYTVMVLWPGSDVASGAAVILQCECLQNGIARLLSRQLALKFVVVVVHKRERQLPCTLPGNCGRAL